MHQLEWSGFIFVSLPTGREIFIKTDKISLSLLLAKETPALSATPQMTETAFHFHHLCGSLLDSFQYIHLSSILGAQNCTCTGLSSGRISLSTCCKFSNSAQDNISHLCSKSTLLAYIWYAVWLNLQLLFCKAAQLISLQHVLVPGVIPFQTGTEHFHLLILIEIPVWPVLQPTKVPPNSSPAIRCIKDSPILPVSYHLQTR